MNIDSFQIGDIVIHDVPLPSDDGDDVILTDAPIELDVDLRRYFRDKIVGSLKKRGLEVVADPEGEATVREAVAAILADNRELVQQSQTLARHLFAIQNKSNSEGLLAVATGTTEDDGAVVSIFKLEREQGLRLQILRRNQQNLVDIEHLRNLTLTDKTKVFKTSILFLQTPGDDVSLAGSASDDQRGMREGEGVANFFLARFLGCRLRANPEITTRDFVKGVETFINGLENQERQASYQIALLATLQDQRRDISPRAFAENNLQADDRPAYRASLEAAGINPATTFQKDLKLAHSTGFKWYFEHGMTLIGSREDVETGRVRVPQSRREPIEIHDTLERLKGR
jgi:hypothetical protein